MSNIDIVESLYEREEEICKFMFKISGFFDEVSPKLEEQLAAMQTLGTVSYTHLTLPTNREV